MASRDYGDGEREEGSAPPAKREKRKYRCRVRSPATIERARRQRRDKANARERRRMNSLNDALEELRSVLPNGNDEPKMTKIETLRFAQDHIARLARLLAMDDDAAAASASPPPHVQLDEAALSSSSSSSSCSLSQPPPFSTHYTPETSPAYPQVYYQRLPPLT